MSLLGRRMGAILAAGTLALGIAGFTFAVLVQGKGYWNHALPGIGLGMVMLGWSVLSPRQRVERKRERLAQKHQL